MEVTMVVEIPTSAAPSIARSTRIRPNNEANLKA